MTRTPGIHFRELRVREGGAERRVVIGEAPDVAGLVRAALDGSSSLELELELDARGERFVVVRGETSRLLRLSDEGAEPLVEGDALVTEFLARLAGASEPLGRRAVARAGEVGRWLRHELHEGAQGRVHASLQGELEPAAQALGGRMRELLQGAQSLLREASEDLARGEALTPETLAALREEAATLVAAIGSRLARLEEASSVAVRLRDSMRARRERVDEYLRAEQLGRKLEKQRHLMDGQKRRLERARAAARLVRSPDAGPSAAERIARERAERIAEQARTEHAAARAELDREEARAAERDAVGAWIERLSSMRDQQSRLISLRAELRESEGRLDALDAAERDARAGIADAESRIERCRVTLAAIEASPEEAARAHEEAAHAARLFGDVKRLAQVRDELRERAREVQLAKIAAERAEEELELAQREIEWSRESPHPRAPSELPALPDLVARRDALHARIQAESDALTRTREELRLRTTELGTRAYLSPELLEAEAREKAEIAARFGSAGLDRAEVEREEAALHARIGALGAAARTAAQEAGELSLRRIAAREAIAEIEGAIPEHLRTRESVEAALSQARAEHADRLHAWKVARDRAASAEQRRSDAEAALRRARSAEESATRRLLDLSGDRAALRDAGFESWDEVSEARLDDRALAELEAEVAEHETLERLVQEGQSRHRDDLFMPRADPAQAELLHDLLAHALDLSRGRHESSSRGLAEIDRRLDALDVIAAELERVEHAAGLSAGEKGGRFEERAREALLRRVLTNAQARLSAWNLPWQLDWSGGRLVVRDAGGGEVPATAVLASEAVALALALELALAGEPVDLACVIVEGATSLPPGECEVRLVLG